ADPGAAFTRKEAVVEEVLLYVLEKIGIGREVRENGGDFRGFAGHLAGFTGGEGPRRRDGAFGVGAPGPAPGGAVAVDAVRKDDREAAVGEGVGGEDAVIVPGVRGDEGALAGDTFLLGSLVQRACPDAGAVFGLAGKVNQQIR